jgi:hypothetical protein
MNGVAVYRYLMDCANESVNTARDMLQFLEKSKLMKDPSGFAESKDSEVV